MPERVSGPPRLVSAGRGSTSGSGRCPSAFRDAARRSTFEPRGSFLLAGAALQALDGARARFGAPPLDAARRSTREPRGSFLLAGAALLSLAARFCWQGQHFRLWTVPERVSGPPPLDAGRRSTFEPPPGSIKGGGPETRSGTVQRLTASRGGAPKRARAPSRSGTVSERVCVYCVCV